MIYRVQIYTVLKQYLSKYCKYNGYVYKSFIHKHNIVVSTSTEIDKFSDFFTDSFILFDITHGNL